MDLKVNKISSYNIATTNISYKNKKQFQNNNLNFKSIYTDKSFIFGIAFAAITALSLSACTSNKIKDENDDYDSIQIENIDNANFSGFEKEIENQPKTSYHYLPTDKNIDAADYDWSETTYPDGRIEKDSLGYQISITPDGERTVINTTVDENGNKITVTVMPDSSKFIHTEYNIIKPDSIYYTEQKFRPDGSVQERVSYKETSADSTDTSKKTIKINHEYYNNKGILLFWNLSNSDSIKNEDKNIYDDKNRLVFNAANNESFEYKGNDTIPHRSIAEHAGCKRYTLYNEDGTIQKIYFEASDGTKTPYEEVIDH